MRRSTTIRLTLLPMLASAAVAAAGDEPPLSPPGMTAPIEEPQDPDPTRPFTPEDMQFLPPGLTPPVDELDCDDDPYWEYRLDCTEVGGGGVIRGGFGHYFWAGGG